MALDVGRLGLSERKDGILGPGLVITKHSEHDMAAAAGSEPLDLGEPASVVLVILGYRGLGPDY